MRPGCSTRSLTAASTCCPTASRDPRRVAAHVTGEVAGVLVGAGQRGRGDLRVVLGRLRGPVAEPSLQLEQGHRFLGVVELAGDGGSGPVAGDRAAHVGGRDAASVDWSLWVAAVRKR